MRPLIPFLALTAGLIVLPGLALAGINASTKTTRYQDRQGRTVMQSKQMGDTTRFQDREGRTIGKSALQPNGTTRVMDEQGRTLYTIKPQN